jgi:hypothetical protein
MMLWPEARRSPNVGIAGATPTPSTDTHATVRPVQRQLRFEPRGPLRLVRREAGAQPAGAIRVGHVDRIEVDADAGDNLGHRPRRDGPVTHDRGGELHGR